MHGPATYPEQPRSLAGTAKVDREDHNSAWSGDAERPTGPVPSETGTFLLELVQGATCLEERLGRAVDLDALRVLNGVPFAHQVKIEAHDKPSVLNFVGHAFRGQPPRLRHGRDMVASCPSLLCRSP